MSKADVQFYVKLSFKGEIKLFTINGGVYKFLSSYSNFNFKKRVCLS